MNLKLVSMKAYNFLFAAGILFFISCVDEYQLPSSISSNYSQEIVIEGRILSGETSTFYVSRTLALTDGRTIDPVTDARITVIGQNGYESQEAEYIEDAQYTIKLDTLNPNTLYAVCVEADGEIYQSDFQPLMETPDIDDVSYRERNGAISLHVSAHNADDASRYCGLTRRIGNSMPKWTLCMYRGAYHYTMKRPTHWKRAVKIHITIVRGIKIPIHFTSIQLKNCRKIK